MRQPSLKAWQARTAILTVFLPVLALSALSGCQAPAESSTSSSIENGQMPDSASPIAHSAIRIEGRYSSRDRFSCSGSVLSSTVILTAGHCVTAESPNGSRRLLSPGDVYAVNADSFFNPELEIAEVMVPDEYLKSAANRDLGYDIALIRLARALPEYYKPALIATDYAASIKKPLYSAGFGAWTPDLSAEDVNSSGDLSYGKVELNLSSNLEAPHIAYGVNRADSKLLKFHRIGYGPALCKGDSGGPVYYEENGAIHLVGVNVAIQFNDAKDAYRYRCANLNADEFASSVSSENLHFISEGFQKFTGQTLPGVGAVRPVEDDPSALDFFLKNGDTAPRKNEWIDLSSLSVSLRSGHLSIYPQASCSASADDISSIQVPYLEALDSLELDTDGIASVTLRKISPQSQSSAVDLFRGKVKIQGNTTALAVLTPSGVVRASLTRSDCR